MSDDPLGSQRLRRVVQAPAEKLEVPPERYHIADLVLDTGLLQVERDGEPIDLPQLSFDLLLELTRAAPNVVTTQELMDRVWRGVVVNPETVAKRIELVRQALGDDPHLPRYIALVRGHGYRLVADVSPADVPARSKTRWLGYGIAGAAVVAAAVIAFNFIGTRDSALPAQPPPNSIAVLPFENVSGEALHDPLVVGIHDDIITQIAKIGALRVISRTSVMQLEPDSTLEAIGRVLNVATVLEGTVQRTGGRIRINVQLIDTRSDEHRWAEAYDRAYTAENLFDIQGEIATAVAAALQTRLTSEERERIRTIPTQNLAAYETYLLGRRELNERNMDDAAKYFQRAIELDSQFAPAYVGLADSYLLQVYYLARSERRADARAAIEKAFTLDDSLGEAYNTLGSMLASAGERSAAERAFLRAIELSPSYAPAYHWYADFLQGSGRSAEALVQANKALELDPLTPILRHEVAEALADLGRFDDALAQYVWMIELDLDAAGAREGIGELNWGAYGRLDEAVIWYRESVGVAYPDAHPLGVVHFGMLYFDLGDFVQAKRWFDRASEIAPSHRMAILSKAILSAHDGNWEQFERYADAALSVAPRWEIALAIRLLADQRKSRYADARARYAGAYPELLADEAPEIDRRTVRAATDLALVLIHTGELRRANLLLERTRQYAETFPRAGPRGDELAEARILAVQGNDEAALQALRRAVDNGWRQNWRATLALDPTLVRLRGTPGFQAIRERLDAEMAVQLARVQKMERASELAAQPQQ